MKRALGAIAAVLVLAVAVPAARAAEAVRFAVTDLVGLEQLQREFGAFRDALTQFTGLEFRFFPVSNRTAAVEALKAEKVDVVLVGPAEYVVFRKRTNAYPIVGFSRPDYFSAIVVLADGPVTTASDLKGKRVAFGDVGSTSNHLAPMQVLKDYGLDPRNDVKAQHVGANVAWEALKRGSVEAIGMNHGRFVAIRGREKELEPGAFRVVARGPDLPNDILVAGTHLDKGVVEKLRKAFADHSKALVEKVLVGEDNQKFKGMKFITRIDDRDYNYVRAMYATIGYPEYAEFVGD